jgi:hypothetical protein
LAARDDVLAVRGPADAGKAAVVRVVQVEKFLLEEVEDAQGTIFGDHGQMSVVRREGKGVDAVVGEFPYGDRVRFLVLGVDRLLDVDLRGIVGPTSPAGVCAGSDVGFAAIVLRYENGVFLLFIVDHESTVHVCGEEEVFGPRNPFDM